MKAKLYEDFLNEAVQFGKKGILNKLEQKLEIAKQAISRKTGARGLRSIMEDLLMETMFELPNEDLEKVIIDEKTVVSNNEPIKLLKTKRKKTSSGN